VSLGRHRFVVEPGELSIVRLPPEDAVPDWAARAQGFVSVTRSNAELSIVCPVELVPDVARSEGGWTAIKLVGPFPFDQVGVLASIVGPLAEAGVSVFALSTFDTDYVLVKSDRLETAVGALERAGHVRGETP
jgi:uncharacterized protein